MQKKRIMDRIDRSSLIRTVGKGLYNFLVIILSSSSAQIKVFILAYHLKLFFFFFLGQESFFPAVTEK